MLIGQVTPHYLRVKDFMKKAGQATPDKLGLPSWEVRVLRAKLILEEALETVRALGVAPLIGLGELVGDLEVMESDLSFIDASLLYPPNLEDIADGCADLSVVSTGTLIACGILDYDLYKEVDEANLRKFGPGSYSREDGKWIKPPDWTPPNIRKAIGLEK